ncbi:MULTISPECIES: hypothetical protein [Vitreoscilla]|uniref:Uncharacterized protein n=1 Tax=Vitreoscilla stercoraria TaxID=61 RepID=A0ABY4EDP0_VITST|nr:MULTISPECIES: hypothetical protein [Vitreoscilla]AUZ05252.2 hypothetical protein ADP71_17250 [Vitreoscilla sp. C1]UOO93411.1 hypothetical protein LVJ81_05115 [Vitreoscilla stercoraria]
MTKLGYEMVALHHFSPNNEKLQSYTIKVDSHCFEELLLLIERWHPTKKSLIKNERNNGTIPELYTVVDFQKPTP